MDYQDKFTEGQRVQCIDSESAMSINVGDTGVVVERGRIKLDKDGYVGGWYHRRFKEIEEVAAMEFQVGQRVKVISKDTWMQGYTGVISGIDEGAEYYIEFDKDNDGNSTCFWDADEIELVKEEPMKYKAGQRIIVTREATWAHGLAGVITGNKTSSTGNFMGYFVTFDDQTKNIHGDRVFWEDHELALEAKEFKVGDAVKVIKVLHGAPSKTLGLQGIIETVGNNGKCHRVSFGDPIGWWAYNDDELEQAQKTMSVTEALHAVVNGKTVVSREGTKVYIENGSACLEYSNGDKDIIMVDNETWKIYVEPPTPKFTPKQLVQNNSGTLGIIMEYKGDLRYAVRFSGHEGGAVRTMDEAELSKVDL